MRLGRSMPSYTPYAIIGVSDEVCQPEGTIMVKQVQVIVEKHSDEYIVS